MWGSGPKGTGTPTVCQEKGAEKIDLSGSREILFTPETAALLHALNLPVLPYRSPNLGPASAAGPRIGRNYLEAFTHANFLDNIGWPSGLRPQPHHGELVVII